MSSDSSTETRIRQSQHTACVRRIGTASLSSADTRACLSRSSAETIAASELEAIARDMHRTQQAARNARCGAEGAAAATEDALRRLRALEAQFLTLPETVVTPSSTAALRRPFLVMPDALPRLLVLVEHGASIASAVVTELEGLHDDGITRAEFAADGDALTAAVFTARLLQIEHGLPVPPGQE